MPRFARMVESSKPDWIPEGMSHTEFALREAISCFERGTADARKLGIINLGHACRTHGAWGPRGATVVPRGHGRGRGLAVKDDDARPL